MPETIEALVEGGKATAGPPLGPALGPLGVNIMQIVKAINEETKAYEGMKVPVKVIVDPATKEFKIEVGTPPTSDLIKKELGIEKGSSNPRTEKVGNLSIEQAKKIALMKKRNLLGKDLKAKVKEVLGVCLSMGVNVEGRDPREIQKAISEGKYDDVLKEE
ncbi:MAG TPA: 50S ribosomal protein L11 [Thermoplasmata archaeon]|nr:50S ribosomal protein L11 [Thermoplasmata archaeon]